MHSGQTSTSSSNETTSTASGSRDTGADLAWAAGFIDADGSLSLYMKEQGEGFRTIRPMIRVTQVCPAALHRLQELFGGSISVTNRRRGTGLSAVLQWSVDGKLRLQPVLERLLPHLYVKQEQAQLLTEVMRRQKRGGYTENERAWFRRRASRLRELNAWRPE